MSVWTRSCREVTRLLLAQSDRRLSLREQAAVRWHMAICKACPAFEQRVVLMREAVSRWRAYRDE
jgi:Putative zinc-finger